MTSPNTTLYLDHAATTPLRPEAREAMAPYLGDAYGNPSGIHAVSRVAKKALEEARERAAVLLGADHPLDVVFTGGGTESDNLGVAGPSLASGGGVVTTSVEHEAVLETAAFLRRLGRSVTVIEVDSMGLVDPLQVARAVGSETAVVSVMTANNETGVRQPVDQISAAVKEAYPEVLVHTDAVQAFVSEETTITSLGADLVTLSAHKFGGPKGVGLLHVRRGVPVEPVLHGGGQEIGRRSGTHNVAGIANIKADHRYKNEQNIACKQQLYQPPLRAHDIIDAEHEKRIEQWPFVACQGKHQNASGQHQTSNEPFPAIDSKQQYKWQQ